MSVFIRLGRENPPRFRRLVDCADVGMRGGGRHLNDGWSCCDTRIGYRKTMLRRGSASVYARKSSSRLMPRIALASRRCTPARSILNEATGQRSGAFQARQCGSHPDCRAAAYRREENSEVIERGNRRRAGESPTRRDARGSLSRPECTPASCTAGDRTHIEGSASTRKEAQFWRASQGPRSYSATTAPALLTILICSVDSLQKVSFASSKSAPLRLALVKSANDRSAPTNRAPPRLAPVRSA